MRHFLPLTIQFFLFSQALLHHKATNVNIEGRNKYTPLHNAAQLENRNALEICQKLVRTSWITKYLLLEREIHASAFW